MLVAACALVAVAAVLGPVPSAGTGATILAVLPVLAGVAAAVSAAASLPSMDCALVIDGGALFLSIMKLTPFRRIPFSLLSSFCLACNYATQ